MDLVIHVAMSLKHKYNEFWDKSCIWLSNFLLLILGRTPLLNPNWNHSCCAHKTKELETRLRAIRTKWRDPLWIVALHPMVIPWAETGMRLGQLQWPGSSIALFFTYLHLFAFFWDWFNGPCVLDYLHYNSQIQKRDISRAGSPHFERKLSPPRKITASCSNLWVL